MILQLAFILTTDAIHEGNAIHIILCAELIVCTLCSPLYVAKNSKIYI